MKKILCAVVSLFLFLGFVSATEKTAFETTLTKVKFNIENCQNEDFQEKTFKKDEDRKKFKELPPLEKRVYIFVFANEFSGKLTELAEFWTGELTKAGEGSDTEASKKDIQKYMDSLKEFRIQNSEKAEELAIQLFKDYPDKFTKEEQDFTLKKLKDFTVKLKGK